MNRQARRHPADGRAMAVPTPMPPPQTGQLHRQLQEPVLVGEISAGEAREIKTLNELTARLEADSLHAQRVLMVAQMHKREFLRQLLVGRGIDTQDVYNIDDDSGRITRTHELVQPEGLTVLAPVQPEPETTED